MRSNDPSSPTPENKASTAKADQNASTGVRCGALVRCREISNLSIHRNDKFWTFTFYNKQGEKHSKIKLATHKIKSIIEYLKIETSIPFYSSFLDECLSSELPKKEVRKI